MPRTDGIGAPPSKETGARAGGAPGFNRDYAAGALIMVLGLGAALHGSQYSLGTLTRMGPGFFPVILGCVMAMLGLLIVGVALVSGPGEDGKRILPANPEWRGWACIVGGPVLFILGGLYGGMAPGFLSCVFVCALGDRTATLRSSLVLAASATAFGVILFHYILQVSFPTPGWMAP